MKKIFNIFALIALCLSVSLPLASCGDDKDEPTGDDLIEQLQGTWHFYHMKIQAMGQTIEFDASDLGDLAQDSGVAGFYDETLTFTTSSVNGNPYEVRGNKLNIPAYYGDTWCTVSFSGGNLVMYYEMVEQGISMQITITYTRGSRSAAALQAPSAASLMQAIRNRTRY